MSNSAQSAMQIKREELNPCTIQLDIVCSPEQVKEGFARAYKEMAKRIRVPGFRPGQAPRAVVEKQVPREEIENAAADEIVRKAFKEALAQENLVPQNTPSVELKALNEEEGKCEFSAKVPLAPIVKLAEYKGVEVDKPLVKVTEDDVEHYLNDIRQRSGKRETITGRGVQEGDYAVVNVKIQDEEGDGRTFMTVVGQTFEDLDKVILGMSAEEIKLAELTFPANFQEKDWAGKKYKCQVTLRSVTAVALPELDDEFAKSMNADNVDELKGRLRERIQMAKEQMSQEMVHSRIMEQLVEKSDIHVPDTTWESVVSQKAREVMTDLQQRNMTLAQYCEQQNMTEDQFKEAMEKEAKHHVVQAVIIENIFRGEKMQITPNEFNMHFLQLARENNVREADLKKFAKEYGQQIRDEVIFRAMHANVMRFLAENAKITEVDMDAESVAPEPKPRKKAKTESGE